MYYLIFDPKVIAFLENDSNEAYDDSILRLYEKRNPEIVGIMVVSTDDRVLSASMQRISRDSLQNEEWYKIAQKNIDSIHTLSNPIGRNIRVIDNSVSGDDVVSLVKTIVREDGSVIGVVLMDIHTEMFERIIGSTFLGKDGFVFLQDSNDNVVYTEVNSIVYRIKPELLKGVGGNTTLRISNKNFKVMWMDSKYTKWKVVGVFSLKEALSSVHKIQLIILFVSGSLILLAFGASFVISDSITKPIAKLKGLMNRVEEGELDLRFVSRYDDEIGQLGQSFNKMLDSMKSLISMVYKEQKEKKEAELEIFRAQIKPHFLYNTLDTIHWLIKEGKNEESVRVVKALTQLFRISLSKGKEIILVDEELKHVESYLTIQNVRYEEKFDYMIYCPDEVRKLSITKLILQPIVENAIYHGIKEKRGKGLITITIWTEEGQIVIKVNDDGVGIAQKEVDRINRVLRKEIPKQNEYGLINVNEKIKIAYGNTYGVQLCSSFSEGTTVIIQHPII